MDLINGGLHGVFGTWQTGWQFVFEFNTRISEGIPGIFQRKRLNPFEDARRRADNARWRAEWAEWVRERRPLGEILRDVRSGIFQRERLDPFEYARWRAEKAERARARAKRSWGEMICDILPTSSEPEQPNPHEEERANRDSGEIPEPAFSPRQNKRRRFSKSMHDEKSEERSSEAGNQQVYATLDPAQTMSTTAPLRKDFRRRPVQNPYRRTRTQGSSNFARSFKASDPVIHTPFCDKTIHVMHVPQQLAMKPIDLKHALEWYHFVRWIVFEKGLDNDAAKLEVFCSPEALVYLVFHEMIELGDALSWRAARHVLGYGLVGFAARDEVQPGMLFENTVPTIPARPRLQKPTQAKIEKFSKGWPLNYSKLYNWDEDEKDRFKHGPFGPAVRTYAFQSTQENVLKMLSNFSPNYRREEKDYPEEWEQMFEPILGPRTKPEQKKAKRPSSAPAPTASAVPSHGDGGTTKKRKYQATVEDADDEDEDEDVQPKRRTTEKKGNSWKETELERTSAPVPAKVNGETGKKRSYKTTVEDADDEDEDVLRAKCMSYTAAQNSKGTAAPPPGASKNRVPPLPREDNPAHPEVWVEEQRSPNLRTERRSSLSTTLQDVDQPRYTTEEKGKWKATPEPGFQRDEGYVVPPAPAKDDIATCAQAQEQLTAQMTMTGALPQLSQAQPLVAHQQFSAYPAQMNETTTVQVNEQCADVSMETEDAPVNDQSATYPQSENIVCGQMMNGMAVETGMPLDYSGIPQPSAPAFQRHPHYIAPDCQVQQAQAHFIGQGTGVSFASPSPFSAAPLVPTPTFNGDFTPGGMQVQSQPQSQTAAEVRAIIPLPTGAWVQQMQVSSSGTLFNIGAAPPPDPKYEEYSGSQRRIVMQKDAQRRFRQKTLAKNARAKSQNTQNAVETDTIDDFLIGEVEDENSV